MGGGGVGEQEGLFPPCFFSCFSPLFVIYSFTVHNSKLVSSSFLFSFLLPFLPFFSFLPFTRPSFLSSHFSFFQFPFDLSLLPSPLLSLSISLYLSFVLSFFFLPSPHSLFSFFFIFSPWIILLVEFLPHTQSVPHGTTNLRGGGGGGGGGTVRVEPNTPPVTGSAGAVGVLVYWKC